MVTAIGSYSTTATQNSGQWVMQMVAFRAAGSPPPPPDTTPPTAPTSLTATTLGTQINLTWAASSDNVAVIGYKVFRNGALVGIDLNDIVGSAGRFLQSRSRQTGVFDERKRTEFTQLTGSARIKDGVAFNDDLKAQTKTLVLTGSGRMDLAADEIDYTLRTQVAAVPAGSPNALRSLTGVTIPVRISGQPDHLGYSIDWTSVAAQALLLRATGGVGAPAVDKVIEGLGGLIGRGKKK